MRGARNRATFVFAASAAAAVVSSCQLFGIEDIELTGPAASDGSFVDAGALDGSSCSVTTPALYISPNGDDTKGCSFEQPCQTFEGAQKAMASSSVKTTYVRAGTYLRSQTYVFGDGETWLGYPCDGPQSAIIDATGMQTGPAFSCEGCSNVVLWGFKFLSAPMKGNNITLAGGRNVHIDNNVFSGNLPSYDESDIQSFNGNDIYIRGNTFESDASAEPISTPFTETGSFAGLNITDNSFNGCQRWCVESQIQLTSISVSDLHIDRNTFTNFQGPNNQCGDGDHYYGAVAAEGPAMASGQWATNATIWGNTLTLPSGTNSCVGGINASWTGTSVEYNTMSYVGAGFSIGQTPGTEFENNTLTLRTTGSVENCSSAGSACAFTSGSGYDGAEWIGVNTINSSQVTGCATPFCSTGHGAYGAQPTSPSMPTAAYDGGVP
jgi:hypothetical protein